MKTLLIGLVCLSSFQIFATDNFFEPNQKFVDTNRQAGGYIERVGNDGALYVMFRQGMGSYNSYDDVISQNGVARGLGCTSDGLVCVGKKSLIKFSDSEAKTMSVSGILKNDDVSVGNTRVDSKKIAKTLEGECVISEDKEVCVGQDIAIYGDKKLRRVTGVFQNGDIAVYDKTIISNHVRTDYSKIIDIENVE